MLALMALVLAALAANVYALPPAANMSDVFERQVVPTTWTAGTRAVGSNGNPRAKCNFKQLSVHSSPIPFRINCSHSLAGTNALRIRGLLCIGTERQVVHDGLFSNSAIK